MSRAKRTVQRGEAVRRGTHQFLNEQRLMIDELTNFIRDICVDLKHRRFIEIIFIASWPL